MMCSSFASSRGAACVKSMPDRLRDLFEAEAVAAERDVRRRGALGGSARRTAALPASDGERRREQRGEEEDEQAACNGTLTHR